MTDSDMRVALDQIEALTDEQLVNWLRPWVTDPQGWNAPANRACSYAALAMRAEGYPDRDIARVVARMIHLIPSDRV